MRNFFLDFINLNEDRIKSLAEQFQNYKIENQKIGFNESKERIINWIRNFDNINFNNLEQVLKFLEKIEYLESQHIQDSLVELSKDYLNDGYITPLGEKSESSFLFTSRFHKHPNFSFTLSDLLDNTKEVKNLNILLFDDFLNSGGQLNTIFYSLLGEELPIGLTNDEGEKRAVLNNEQKPG